MKKADMLKGMQLALNLVKKRLNNTALLLKSDYPYDSFILYSFAYEEFGKALIIKDCIDKNKDGLPKWLLTGRSAHKKKMAKAKQHVPFRCSNFTPWISLLHPNSKTETVSYKVWRDKDIQVGTISRPHNATGRFADVTCVDSTFDEITRVELLFVNWDPRTNEWHTNPD
jgi:hypothetical protein